jgi:hypothetical protein
VFLSYTRPPGKWRKFSFVDMHVGGRVNKGSRSLSFLFSVLSRAYVNEATYHPTFYAAAYPTLPRPDGSALPLDMRSEILVARAQVLVFLVFFTS